MKPMKRLEKLREDMTTLAEEYEEETGLTITGVNLSHERKLNRDMSATTATYPRIWIHAEVK